MDWLGWNAPAGGTLAACEGPDATFVGLPKARLFAPRTGGSARRYLTVAI